MASQIRINENATVVTINITTSKKVNIIVNGKQYIATDAPSSVAASVLFGADRKSKGIEVKRLQYTRLVKERNEVKRHIERNKFRDIDRMRPYEVTKSEDSLNILQDGAHQNRSIPKKTKDKNQKAKVGNFFIRKGRTHK